MPNRPECLTSLDWAIINQALAVYEAGLEDYAPDPYRSDDPDDFGYDRERAVYEAAVAATEVVRTKVHQRLEGRSLETPVSRLAERSR